MTAIRTIEVVNAVWPGGVGLQPPSAETPHWRTAEGRRHSLSTVVAGCETGRRTTLVRAHLDGIHAIVAAAAEAELGGDRGRARRLVAAATRLCGELIGQWPDGTWEQDGRG